MLHRSIAWTSIPTDRKKPPTGKNHRPEKTTDRKKPSL
jgi:hypothetical protein